MFDQMKQAKELYRLQKELQKESFEVEEKGVKVVMNGKMEIEEVSLNEDLERDEQERVLKSCFNEIIKKVQMFAAQKMQSLR